MNGAHNVIQLITGVAALAAGGLRELLQSRRFFQIFAVIYGLVTLLGLFVGHGFVAHNGNDIRLHAIITPVAGYFGFRHATRLART